MRARRLGPLFGFLDATAPPFNFKRSLRLYWYDQVCARPGACASPSSSGLGHRPFTAVTRVRIPSGTPIALKCFPAALPRLAMQAKTEKNPESCRCIHSRNDQYPVSDSGSPVAFRAARLMQARKTIASFVTLLLLVFMTAASACAASCDMRRAAAGHAPAMAGSVSAMAPMEHCGMTRDDQEKPFAPMLSGCSHHQLCVEQAVAPKEWKWAAAQVHPLQFLAAAMGWFLVPESQKTARAQGSPPPLSATPLTLHTLLRV